MTDIRDVLRALPHPPDDGTRYALTDLFTVRHEIIRRLDPPPRSVFEFGALYGFFLVTALDAAPSIGMVAWVDDESHTLGSNFRCELNLRHARPGIETIDRFSFEPLYAYATSRDQIPAGSQFDLVQVDSDHSYAGCLADLHAAAQLEPRWIMVDDWTAPTHRDEIQAAVFDWLATQPADGWELTEHQTVNGLALLTRNR